MTEIFLQPPFFQVSYISKNIKMESTVHNVTETNLEENNILDSPPPFLIACRTFIKY